MARQERIKTHLEETLAPLFMEVQNESKNHHVPPDSETHFKVTIVSDKFEGLMPVARHKMIYEILDWELKNGLHALSLHLYTPEKWFHMNHQTPASPACRDGFDKSEG